MDATAWANIIAGIAVVIAVAVAVRGELNARAQDRRAEVAERSARESVAEARRLADSIEAMQLHRAPTVRWALDPSSDAADTVSNVGLATAYAADLACTNAVKFDALDTPRDVQPGEALRFSVLTAWGAGPLELVVTWSDEPGGTRRTWRHPLP